jgi:energy-coupling factor transporter ATP-binding protein EcfA2
MISRLHVQDFTCFADVDLHLGPLNVFVGENGTGKTHLLKLLYLLRRVGSRSHMAHSVGYGEPPLPIAWAQVFREEAEQTLGGVFLTDSPGSLVRWDAVRAELRAWSQGPAHVGVAVEPSGRVTALTEPGAQYPPEDSWLEGDASFLQTRDVLTEEPGMARIYEDYEIREDASVRDLIEALRGPPRKWQSLDPSIQRVLADLETAVGGKPESVDEHWFLVTPASRRIPATLAAEGHRRLATLAALLTRSRLGPGWLLLWDEPEANLNPALIRVVAKALVDLAVAGIQVCIATHSLFLLREVSLLLANRAPRLPARYFGLHASPAGTTVSQGDTIEDVGDIRSLDEDLDQASRYLDVESGVEGRG